MQWLYEFITGILASASYEAACYFDDHGRHADMRAACEVYGHAAVASGATLESVYEDKD